MPYILCEHCATRVYRPPVIAAREDCPVCDHPLAPSPPKPDYIEVKASR